MRFPKLDVAVSNPNLSFQQPSAGEAFSLVRNSRPSSVNPQDSARRSPKV
jgi:hypothetical protein